MNLIYINEIISNSEIIQNLCDIYQDNLIYVICDFFYLLHKSYRLHKEDFEFNEDLLYVLGFVMHNSPYSYYNAYDVHIILYCIICYCSIDFDMYSDFLYIKNFKKKYYFNSNFMKLFNDHSYLIHKISTNEKVFSNWKANGKNYLKK